MIIKKGDKCVAYAGIIAGSNQCLTCSNMSYSQVDHIKCLFEERKREDDKAGEMGV